MDINPIKTEGAERIYELVTNEALYSLERVGSPKEDNLAVMKKALLIIRADCMANEIYPDNPQFWYNQTASFLSIFGQLISGEEPSYSCSELIKGLLTLSGCSHDEEDLILEKVKKRTSALESMIKSPTI
ncbi:MAG: hypothetical protein AABW47_00855 [Nanoarchaeota archaeon]